MTARWQLQEAKNRFSEVVDEALAHGPQTATRHGREVVVIVAAGEFRRIKQPKGSLLAQCEGVTPSLRCDPFAGP